MMSETETVTDKDQKETSQTDDHPKRSEGNGSTQNEKYDVDLILDIPLEVTVELGKVKMLVNDLLQLGQGSIIELDKPVGERLEIYISDKLIARGEVVVAEDKLGVRVTDIVSPTERVKSLGR
jgi:flagellar motor switch protein FliN/FliY